MLREESAAVKWMLKNHNAERDHDHTIPLRALLLGSANCQT